jgi:hypothetical protein
MHALSLSARGAGGRGIGDTRTSSFTQPFTLVVGEVNRVLICVYSLENEKATFSTGHVLDYPGTIPYCHFHPN